MNEVELRWLVCSILGVLVLFLLFICLTCSKQLKRYFTSDQTTTTVPQAQRESEFNQGMSSDDLSGGEILATSDLDELEHLEEQHEIELFLAEIRSSEMNSLSMPLSTLDRREYIANVLISQRLRVVDVEDTGIEDGKFQKGKLFLYQELVGIERSGVGEASPSMARTPPQCAICLVEYQQEDDICWSHNKRCNHHFHRLCMIEWLSDHNECPCCRNNYLALSDDEEKEEGSDTSLPESISLFSHFDPPISPSESSEDPYVIDGLLLDQLAATDMRIPDLEVCLRPDNVSAATLSSAGSVYTERDSWISDEDVVEVALGDENATDDWSCPSVPDLTGPVNVDEYHAPRRRRTLQQAGSLQQSRQDIKDDQIVSLQLDDLIVDGLMRRLDEKEGGRCGGPRNEDGSESSGSVYTKGSYGDVGTTINKTNSISRHSSVDDTHTCAVCRKQYEVNEQVCWSTDPPCDHVFHRECLNKWIADDHTHCPFCNAKEVGFSAKVALPCVKEGSNFSLDGKYAFSGTTDSDVESQERSIF